jgi:hypothetical protein
MTIWQLIIDFVNKQYRNANYDVRPVTFIINDNYINEIKNDLVDNKILFNDWYEYIKFNESIFFEKPIINKWSNKLKSISFKIRILSESNFNIITDYGITYNKSYFFSKNSLEFFKNKPYMEINWLNSKQIGDILSFN